MSISPLGPNTIYPRPVTVNVANPAPAAAANEAPLVVTPVGQIKTDPVSDSFFKVKNVMSAAMTGKPLVGASSLQSKFLGALQKGQALVTGLVHKLSPVAPTAPVQQVSALAETQPKTFIEKAKQVGRSAIFFAAPIGAAAAGAALLGWFVGPIVPIIGGHVFGAVAAALAVGHTSGMLLHGGMRLGLVTRPEDKDLNSAGVTLGSAAIGAGLAAAIGAAAGATVGLPLLAAGAALGAAPRLVEWWLAKL